MHRGQPLSGCEAECQSFSVLLLHRTDILMLLRTPILLVLSGAALHAVVIDRMAVIVGKHVIKLSDINRDLRATEFLNHQPPDFSPDARRKAADRLIEQTIIRDEIANGGYQWAPEADADAMLSKLRQERFAGSDAQLRAALSGYGLTE